MTALQVLLNLLFAVLAFLIVRYVASLVMPTEPKRPQDRETIINIVALIAAVVVFFLNFAARLVAS